MNRTNYLFFIVLSIALNGHAAQGELLEESSFYSKNSSFRKVPPVIEHVMLEVPEFPNAKHVLKRKGILTRYKDARATVIICHGFMCDKYDTGFLRQLFPKGMYNVFTFDFRAHGEESQGQWCTFGKHEAQEVIQAGKFIKEHPSLADKPIFVYGFSMGAVAAIEAQAIESIKGQTLFNGMILDCPFASSENVIKKGLENAKISLFGYEFGLPCKSILAKHAFHPYVQSFVKYLLKTVARFDAKDINTIISPLHPVESIKHVSVPCFFIHCKEDEKISTEDVRKIYENAQGIKRLWLTNGRRHYDSLFYNPEKYKIQIRQFLQYVLDGSYANEPVAYVWEDQIEHSIPVLIAPQQNKHA